MKKFLFLGILSALNPFEGYKLLKDMSEETDYRSHWYTVGGYLNKAIH